MILGIGFRDAILRGVVIALRELGCFRLIIFFIYFSPFG